MKRNFYLVFTLVLLAMQSHMADAQDFTFPQLKSYKAVSDYPVYTPDDLWNYINGAADAYLALGFIDLHINEYVKGKQIIKAELYRFGSEERAFGIYSLERSPDYSFIRTGVQGYNADGVVNFYKGCYYVKIMTHSTSAKANDAMLSLASSIAERIDAASEFPAPVRAFPREGLLDNQETYILEGVLGHDYLQGAYRASYEIDGDRFEIYQMETASPQAAASALSALTGIPGSSVTDEVEKYVTDDGYNGTLFIVRKGPKIVIISGLTREKDALAVRFLDQIIK